MKNITSFLCIILLNSCTSNLTVIEGRVTDSECGNMAYLFTSWENQFDLVDSAQIVDGKFRFATTITEPRATELLIPGIFPIDLPFVSAGDRLVVDIRSNKLQSATGSETVELYYSYIRDLNQIGVNHIIPLEARLHQMLDVDTHNALVDSLKYYRSLQNELLTNLILSTPNPYQASACLHLAQEKYLDKVQTDSILKILGNKFPGSEPLISYGMEEYAPISPKSQEVMNYKLKLLGFTGDFPIRATIDSESPASTRTPYEIGQTVDNFSLIDASGQQMSLQLCSIITDYTLIDFWATWCQPCLKDNEVLDDLTQRYDKKLMVYAISIDKDVEVWERHVKKSRINKNIIHVSLPENSERYDEFQQLFKLREIPHNILIDKRMRIVAMDIHNKDLEKFLNSENY